MPSYGSPLAAEANAMCFSQRWIHFRQSPAITPPGTCIAAGESRRFCSAISDVAQWNANDKRTLRRRRTWVHSTNSEEPWSPGNNIEGEPPFRIEMDNSPLPEYLTDMLQEGGLLDADGNPINKEETVHPYDDEDIFGTSSDRQRDAEAADKEDEYFDLPSSDMFHKERKLNPADEFGLMDTTINEAVLDYGFPLEFFLDVVTRWGVPPPIDQDIRIGDLVSAEQAFALGEALNGLDAADVRDNYMDERVEDLAVELDMPLPDLLQACAVHKINLPQGTDTHITIDEYKILLDAVTDDEAFNPQKRRLEENRMRHRWVGMKELASRRAVHALEAEVAGVDDHSRWWKDGPPVVGTEEGDIHPDDIYISGRIFGEEYFGLGAQDDKEDLFELDEDNKEVFEWEE